MLATRAARAAAGVGACGLGVLAFKSSTTSTNCNSGNSGSNASSLVTLTEVRDRARAFAQERNWDQYHSPRNLALALVGEVGELCECMQWKKDEGAQEGLVGWSEDEKAHLGEELADVLIYLVRLSDKCGIDLDEAVRKKFGKNARKYPAKLVFGSSKKYTEYGIKDDA